MTMNILSIEDSAADLRLIEREMKKGGLDAHCTRVDTPGALAQALTQKWDLVLSDYNVPGLVFEESIVLIREHCPRTPIILVSGSVGEEKAVDLLKLGARDFILKDRLIRLVPAIERCLRESAERCSRENAEIALRESEARLRTLGDNLPDGLIYQLITTPDGSRTFTYISRGIERLVGVSPTEIMADAQALYGRVHPDDATWLGMAERQAEREGCVFDVELRLIHRNGQLRWVNLRSSPRPNTHGRTLWDGIAIDITDKYRDREQLRLAASVFANSLEAILITDAKHLIIDVNPACMRIMGYERHEVLGKNPFMFSVGLHDSDFFGQIWRTLCEKEVWRGEIWSRRKSGEIFPELLSIAAVRDETGTPLRYVSVFTDISQLKAHEAALDRIAHFDTLTGLPNRQLLARRMEEAIDRARDTRAALAVCYLDLDGFKDINDRFGHDAGDQLLVNIVSRLDTVLGPHDTLARLGGDEFVLLLHLQSTDDDIFAKLDQLQHLVAAYPPTVDNTAVSISASIGVTLFPHDNTNAETLLRHADQAMYGAKDAGKNRFHLYDLDHEHQIASRRTMLHSLAEALAQNQFVLYFQPMVNLATHEVISAEALIRWQHPQRGLLAPGEFLPAMSGTELEIAVGEWVIAGVLDQLCAWKAQGLRVHASANVCASHLLRPDFVTQLAAALARHPSYEKDDLELEILESAAISDLEQARQTLNACCQLGVCFALDDFGTGYASLTYFRKLPVETLKIDQTFVRDMLNDPEDLGIVESVIRLAEVFDRGVIAEGVETMAHGEKLLSLGCQLAQGYGIARPMPAAQLPVWIAQWRASHAANPSLQSV